MKTFKNSPLALLLGLPLILSATPSAYSAVVDVEWTGPRSGLQYWEEPNNWSIAPKYPNNGTDTYRTVIRNATSDHLLIETLSASSITVATLNLDQSGTGSTTLRLGNDFTVAGVPSNFSNSNATSPDKLVIDLNGYTFKASNTTDNYIRSARNYTIRDTSTGGNGIFNLSSIQAAAVAGRVNVENSVTVKVDGIANMRGLGDSRTEGWNFSADSTLWFAGAGYAGVSYSGGTLGHLVVGDPTGTATRAYLNNNTQVLGDVTYHADVNGVGSVLSLGNSVSLFVAGNFTDKNSGHGIYGYVNQTVAPSPKIYFNGGIGQEREVWITAPTTVLLQVGENATSLGNIRLMHDLTTRVALKADETPTVNSGIFRVGEGSRINLDTFKVTAVTVDISRNTELAYTFGSQTNALIHATGVANDSLIFGTGFKLELKYDEAGWVNGNHLMLFRYDGTTFRGTPTLLGLSVADGLALTHDGLGWGEINGVNYVYLQNVALAIPEPGTVTLLALLGAGLFGLPLRKRIQRRLS